MTDARELSRRADMAKGQIMEALGYLAAMSPNNLDAHHAFLALRRALLELDGGAEAAPLREAAE
jgi:hypothetical protein